MPEYVTEQIRVERRTYLKGRFTGKFIGYLDFPSSDIKTENFYDLEILSGEMSVKKADFRIWKEGDEFEEFADVERFLTKLPDPMPCEVLYDDGTTKYFNLSVNQAKLVNYKLNDQLYENDKLFATITGEISGYLKHYDFEEVIKEIPDPPVIPTPPIFEETGKIPAPAISSAPPTFNEINYPANNLKNDATFTKTTGGFKSGVSTNFNGCAEGCAIGIGISFLGILGIFVVLYVIGIIGRIFVFTSTITISPLTSDILSLLVVGIILFIFVKIQLRLSPVWKWIFRFVMVVFLLFITLNALGG